MQLGYTIIYVANVEQAVEYYERAFGLERGFIHEAGDYGEMNTGQTTLAFTAHELATEVVPGGFTKLDPKQPPAAFELTLVTDDVQAAFDHAVANDAVGVMAPVEKPWGQTVCYLRDPFGTLVSIASPVSG